MLPKRDEPVLHKLLAVNSKKVWQESELKLIVVNSATFIGQWEGTLYHPQC